MRASLTNAGYDTATLAQVASLENGERDAAIGVSAPEPAAVPTRAAKIVRIGRAARLAGSVALSGIDYQNGARLTIRATRTIRAIDTQRGTSGERGRCPSSCAQHLTVTGPQTGIHGAANSMRSRAASADVSGELHTDAVYASRMPRNARQACRKLTPQVRACAIPTKINRVRPGESQHGQMDATGIAAAKQAAMRWSRAQTPGDDGVYFARVEAQARATRRQVRLEAAVALRTTQEDEHFEGQHAQHEMSIYTPVQIDAPFTYDALYVTVDAMKRANSIDAPKVLAAMPVTGHTGVTGQIAFDDKGGLKEGAIARRDIDGGGNAVFRRHGRAMTGFTLGGTDLSDGAVFASASGGFASIHIEADRFRAVNP